MMLTLTECKRLKELKTLYQYDIAFGKQDGVAISDDAELLKTLEVFHLASQVNSAINEYAGHDSDTESMAEGIATVVKTALQGLAQLHKQDPELALRLACVVQSELEQALRGKNDGTTKDRSGG